MNEIKFFEIVFDKNSWEIHVNTNSIVLVILIILFVAFKLYLWRLKKNKVRQKFTPVKFKYSLGGAEIEYEIERNYQNIEIAHRIYIELITRKAAIEINEDEDVVIEVYNSWYKLFSVVREELKGISGKTLHEEKFSNELTKNLTEILNLGLRPHLTMHQAKFRKWYDEESKNNPELSPQEIQKKYPEFERLVASMKEVNNTLMQYAAQLNKFIKG